MMLIEINKETFASPAVSYAKREFDHRISNIMPLSIQC